MLQEGWSWTLDGEKYENYQKWYNRHRLGEHHGAMGGTHTFEITPLSAGVAASCHAFTGTSEEDILDLSDIELQFS